MMALIATTVLIATTLTGCAGASANRTLIVSQGVDATTLDPGMHSETPTGNVERQIFDTLLMLDDKMQFQAAIATEWSAVNDLTWEFAIREGVKFHDGVELTAGDVKYSIDRILNPEKRSPQAANLSAIAEVQVLGEHRLRIVTKEPYPVLTARLAGLRIVPQHYVEQVGDAAFAAKPIGSGPYVFVDWVKDEKITLRANAQYWRGKPAVDEVVFQPIPEAASRMMALQAGQVDIAVNVPPDQIATIDKSGVAKVAKVASSRVIFVPFMTERGPLADARVRHALNLAVDVQAIVDGLLNGNGIVMSQPLSQMDFGYNESVSPYGFDPARAKELLAEAGYAGGFKLTFTTPSGRYSMDKEVAEAVKSQLEAIGLEIELKVLEWGVYVDQIMSHKLNTDLWLIGWGNSLFDADGTLYSWFRSGQRFNFFSTSREQANKLDNLLDLARTTLDADSRLGYYRQVLAEVQSAAPWLLLYQQMDIYGVNNRLEWSPRADEAINIYDVAWK